MQPRVRTFVTIQESNRPHGVSESRAEPYLGPHAGRTCKAHRGCCHGAPFAVALTGGGRQLNGMDKDLTPERRWGIAGKAAAVRRAK